MTFGKFEIMHRIVAVVMCEGMFHMAASWLFCARNFPQTILILVLITGSRLSKARIFVPVINTSRVKEMHVLPYSSRNEKVAVECAAKLTTRYVRVENFIFFYCFNRFKNKF